ncbi:MAG: plasmid pRiA4b ORF-3 family protein [Bacteroidales bacterium]|jgi:hypothetical protein|nr:plasmid pRiA4b ORF-3 family protein [Bacteroidales bacterium]
MEKTNYQIKISLKNSKPNIWRRIVISSDTSLEDFHKIIQTTMGWTNSHLHQFIKGKTYYLVPLDDDNDFFGFVETIDYIEEKIIVSDLLVKEKDKIVYEYDFGDGWMHDILLEKILVKDPKLMIPVCLKGKMCCPPEDCGGIWGYYQLLDIIQNPKHSEYEEMIEWLDEDFEPEYFDKEYINELLQEEDFGSLDFLMF